MGKVPASLAYEWRLQWRGQALPEDIAPPTYKRAFMKFDRVSRVKLKLTEAAWIDGVICTHRPTGGVICEYPISPRHVRGKRVIIQTAWGK